MSQLAGKRVVVTRAAHQAEELAKPLRALGADIILLPVLSIVPPEDLKPLQMAARRVDSYDWIVFSSANAVAAFAGQLPSLRLPPNVKMAVVGSATRDAVERMGWKVDVVPDKFVAEDLVAALAPFSLDGKRVLIPSAAVTRDVISPALMKLGATVEMVAAYRNVAPSDLSKNARRVFSAKPKPDWITFTSSSAVDNLIEAVGSAALESVRIASIGPITSLTIRRYGLNIDAEPAEHTVEALAACMA